MWVCGWTISENLVAVRDLLEYAKREYIPLAISLDEKAFNRVDWGFLLCIVKT